MFGVWFWGLKHFEKPTNMCFWSKPRLVFQTVRFSMVDARVSWVYYIAPSIPAEICQVWEVSRPSMCLFTFERFLMISCAFPLWTSLWGGNQFTTIPSFRVMLHVSVKSWSIMIASPIFWGNPAFNSSPTNFQRNVPPISSATAAPPLWQFTRGIAGSRGRARRLGPTLVYYLGITTLK